MVGHVVDQYVRIVIVVIGAVTVTNAIVNYRGSVALVQAFGRLPVELAQAIRR